MPLEPKHLQISRDLLAEIAAGKYGPAGRLPSEAQLGKRFGVSRPTVARALRDLQEQGLIERRVGSGTYMRSAPAPLSAPGGRHFGLMIPGLGTTEIFEAICAELAGLARGYEYGLLWGSNARPSAGQKASVSEVEQWCEQFIKRQVSGVFFAPFERVPEQEEVNRHLAERLRQAGIAVVLLDRDLGPFPSRSECDLVGIDNFAAGYMVGEHLLKLKSKRLTFIARPNSAPTINGRIAGVREAMLDRGLSIPTDFLRVGEPDDPRFIQKLVEAEELDAAVCANDQTAALLIRGLERKCIRVPRDIRVVGFDDVRLATLVSVPLTTVHQPCQDIAVTAFRAMLERIAEPVLPARSFGLTPRLVIRESCGAYSNESGRLDDSP